MGKFLTKAGGPLFDPLRDRGNKPGGALYDPLRNATVNSKPGGALYDPVRDAVFKGGSGGGGGGGGVGTPAPIAPSPGGIGYGTPGWTPMANAGVPTGQQQSIALTPQGYPMSGSSLPSYAQSQGMPMASSMASMAAGGGIPAGMGGFSPGMVAAAMNILGQNMGSNRPQDQI